MNDATQQLEQLKVEFKLLWGTRKELLFAFVCLAAVFLIGYFLAYAEYNKIDSNQANLNDAQEKVETSNQLRANWQRALNSPEYQASAEIVNEVLPSTKPVLADIYAFNQLVATHPISMTKFEFAPGALATSGAVVANGATTTRSGTGRPTDDYILISLSAVGQFDAMMQFLDDMEKMIPIGNIYTAQIAKTRSGSSSVRMTYLSYYFDQQTRASATLTLPQLTGTDRNNIASVSAYTKLLSGAGATTGLAGGVKPNLFGEIETQTGSRDQELLDLIQQQATVPEVESALDSSMVDQLNMSVLGL